MTAAPASLDHLLATPVTWHRTGDPEEPYAATVTGRAWRLRLNDFPVEALYTLLIDGDEAGEFDDWPPAWIRPAG